MGSARTSLKNLILSTFLVFYFINQAYSIQCYNCASDTYGECYQNPSQNKFLIECSVDLFNSPNRIARFSNFTNVLPVIFSRSLNNQNSYSSGALEFDCATFQGTYFNNKGVVRSCALKGASCDFYRDALQGTGMKVEMCDRCSGPYCNSSVSLTAGLWSIAISIMMLFYIKM